ncbi:hypothetical protein GGX14DRAFT_346163 [Mycena pura]|uniref:Uncharacterized protein n=1 Tax=Mycena pura TaxID=153505 RepID=A0AAD7E5S4_9AGAR|nr:hypothetical protein GGX14DRAFT_346163 [Mycena pura]
MSDISNSTYYGPVGETYSEILLEKTFLQAGYLTALGFGMQLIIYGACVHLLWTKQRHSPLTKIFIPYLTILCLVNLVWTATSAYGLQLTYIDNRNYPGGVIAFLGVEFALPANVANTASFIAENLLADGLMIWRCYIVWAAVPHARGKALLAITLPCLMLLASFSNILTGWPGLFAHTTAVFATPYFALSMTLNMLVSLLIVGRIWMYKHRNLALAGYGHKNISFGAIFLESALPYSVVAMFVVVTFELGHPISQIWLAIAPAAQVIANYVIIYRIALGSALQEGNLEEIDIPSSRPTSESDHDEKVDA